VLIAEDETLIRLDLRGLLEAWFEVRSERATAEAVPLRARPRRTSRCST
jgi:hypothetical protein